MRLTATTFALSLLPALAAAGPAVSDEHVPAVGAVPVAHAPTSPARAANASATTTRPAHGATALPAAAKTSAAPFNPRWVAPKVQMKGLVVWVFTPGHFQRD